MSLFLVAGGILLGRSREISLFIRLLWSLWVHIAADCEGVERRVEKIGGEGEIFYGVLFPYGYTKDILWLRSEQAGWGSFIKSIGLVAFGGHSATEAENISVIAVIGHASMTRGPLQNKAVKNEAISTKLAARLP